MKASEAIEKVRQEIGPMYPQWAKLLADTNNTVKPMETLATPLNSTLLNISTTVKL